ncbi:hypothetical protein ACWDBW_38485 [Streptomyces sp. NPDC001107]
MLDPFSASVLGAAALIGPLIGVAIVAVLTVRYLRSWWQARLERRRINPRLRFVTVRDDASFGNATYVQGLFDDDQHRFVDSRRIWASGADEDVRRAHGRNPVAVWT